MGIQLFFQPAQLIRSQQTGRLVHLFQRIEKKPVRARTLNKGHMPLFERRRSRAVFPQNLDEMFAVIVVPEQNARGRRAAQWTEDFGKPRNPRAPRFCVHNLHKPKRQRAFFSMLGLRTHSS